LGEIAFPVDKIDVDAVREKVEKDKQECERQEAEMVASGKAKPRRSLVTPEQELIELQDLWEQLTNRKRYHQERVATAEQVIAELNEKKAAGQEVLKKFGPLAKTNGIAADLVRENGTDPRPPP